MVHSTSLRTSFVQLKKKTLFTCHTDTFRYRRKFIHPCATPATLAFCNDTATVSQHKVNQGKSLSMTWNEMLKIPHLIYYFCRFMIWNFEDTVGVFSALCFVQGVVNNHENDLMLIMRCVFPLSTFEWGVCASMLLVFHWRWTSKYVSLDFFCFPNHFHTIQRCVTDCWAGFFCNYMRSWTKSLFPANTEHWANSDRCDTLSGLQSKASYSRFLP